MEVKKIYDVWLMVGKRKFDDFKNAEKLYELCRPATHGDLRTQTTKTDEKVRKARELKADEFHLLDSMAKWRKAELPGVIQKIATHSVNHLEVSTETL